MPAENPYRALIGDDWEKLPAGIRRSHTVPLRASGRLHVVRAATGLACFLARHLRLPPTGTDVPVTLQIEGTERGVEWVRTFGGQRLDTLHTFHEHHLLEHFKPFSVIFKIVAENGSVVFHQVGLRLFGLPVPRPIGPHVWARITAGTNERSWCIEVQIRHVWFGEICRYQGNMEEE